MNLGRPDRSERLDVLAAGHALGTLSPRARRRLARAARADPVVAQALQGWALRLGGLAQGVPGVTPPPRVWEGIRQQLGFAGDAAAAQPAAAWSSLGLWRGLALAGFALAFALSVALLATPSQRPDESIIAVLAGPDGKPALVASAPRGGRYLAVKAVVPLGVEPGKTLELWMLPDGRDPQSLGIVPAAGAGRIALPAAAGTTLQAIPALAVSLEPAGGSPTGKPTGPVLYSGAIRRMD
jgi:anti-sigma-K factor RskA